MCGTCEAVEVVESVEVIENVYHVPECNLPNMEEQLAKLNRRAAKLKVDGISFTKEFHEVRYQVLVQSQFDAREEGPHSEWWTKEQIEATNRDGDMSLRGAKTTGAKMAWYAVTVSGKTPKLPGWSLIACLEPVVTNDGQENLIKTVPGKECPKHVAQRVGQCDHCNTKRMRTETFVVQNDASGEYKVVGRQCIADFLGGKDPEWIVRVAQWLMAIDELCDDCEEMWESEGGGYIPRGELTETLLAVTAAVIAKLGWRSKASCEFGGIPTADDVCVCLFPSPFDTVEQRELRLEIMGVVEDYVPVAQAAIAWASSISEDKLASNSYLANCNLLARTEWMTAKHFGLGCSIVAAYQREMATLKEQERRAKLPPSQHVGELKKRLTMVVTCDMVKQLDNDWGTTGLHKLIDDNGNHLTWFASGDTPWLEAGCKYRIKATVVKHDEYKGNKQTNVNRVAVIDELNEDGSIKLQVSDWSRELWLYETGTTVQAKIHVEEQIVNVTKKKQAHKWFWTVTINDAQVGSGQSDSSEDAERDSEKVMYAWQNEANEGKKKW